MSTESESLTEAIRLREKMKATGCSGEGLAVWFEAVVRRIWPKGRAWIYICDLCRDYGLETKWCQGDTTCGRNREHAAHEYGVPCSCVAGQRYQPKPRSAEDFTQAGTAKRKLSRYGR